MGLNVIDLFDKDQDPQGDLQHLLDEFRGIVETAIAEARNTGKHVEVTTNMLILPPCPKPVPGQAEADSGGTAVHTVMRRHRWHWK